MFTIAGPVIVYGVSASAVYILFNYIVPYIAELEPFHRFLGNEKETVLKFVFLAADAIGGAQVHH